jgi:hypothetical protein
MIDILVLSILFICIVILAVAFFTLRSSRRAEQIGEGRYELLRDHQERLEFLREERQMLVDQLLERQSQERQRFTEDMRPHAVGDLAQERLRLELEQELEQERQAGRENVRKVEEQEQERQRLEQECSRLEEELKRSRQDHLEAQRRVEQLERERLGLEQKLGRSGEGLGSGGPGARPWWRKPIPVVALLLGAVLVWLTSLVVALNLLT